jgi:hypothetical protein
MSAQAVANDATEVLAERLFATTIDTLEIEWLEQQAVAGFLSVDDVDAEPDFWRFYRLMQ